MWIKTTLYLVCFNVFFFLVIPSIFHQKKTKIKKKNKTKAKNKNKWKKTEEKIGKDSGNFSFCCSNQFQTLSSNVCLTMMLIMSMNVNNNKFLLRFSIKNWQLKSNKKKNKQRSKESIGNWNALKAKNRNFFSCLCLKNEYLLNDDINFINFFLSFHSLTKLFLFFYSSI